MIGSNKVDLLYLYVCDVVHFLEHVIMAILYLNCTVQDFPVGESLITMLTFVCN